MLEAHVVPTPAQRSAAAGTRTGLGSVVLDEVHYLSDRFRGAVWEEVIIHLRDSVQVVALSATVSNAEEFGEWLVQVRGDTTVIVDEHRPVPLWQHMFADGRLYDLFTSGPADVPADSTTESGAPGAVAKVNPELLRIARREDWAARAGRRPQPGGRRPRRFRPPSRVDVIERLDAAGLLPAITFIFSRTGCDAAVPQCLPARLPPPTPPHAAAIPQRAGGRTAD